LTSVIEDWIVLLFNAHNEQNNQNYKNGQFAKVYWKHSILVWRSITTCILKLRSNI